MVCRVVRQQRRPVIVLPPRGTINIVFGAHDLDMDLAGFSVEEIQLSLRDLLNVGMEAIAYADGQLASPTYRLCPGDRLEFVRPFGRKGAVDLDNEEVLSFAQAGRRLPQVRGATATGKGVHPVTLWRWARRGLNGPDGQKVLLEIIRIGGTNCTSVEALERFFNRLQGQQVPLVSHQPQAERKRAARAMEELRKLGF
jgi:hypothetical protein